MPTYSENGKNSYTAAVTVAKGDQPRATADKSNSSRICIAATKMLPAINEVFVLPAFVNH